MPILAKLDEIPTVPVRIDDVPPGWLAWLANIAIILTAAAALGTFFIPLWIRRASKANLDVLAERDSARVYVRLANKGGEALNVRKVLLGVIRSDGNEGRVFHLWSNVKTDATDPFILKPGDYKLIQLDWPQGEMRAASVDSNGQAGYTPVAADDVRVIVRLFMDFKVYEIHLEPNTAQREK